MTNAPYLLPKARGGYRMGHGEIIDHMFYDGLQSPWDGKAMGCFADATAEKYGFTREQQDAFAAESVRRAQRAVARRRLRRRDRARRREDPQGRADVAQDETPFALDIDKIPGLKPAFAKDGTVTAASSSSISDGAAAIVIASAALADARGPEAAGAHRRLGEPRPGARVVHDRPRARDSQGARPRRLEGRPTWTSSRSTRPSPA